MWKLRKYNLLNRRERPVNQVRNLEEGDIVKLVFEPNTSDSVANAERMWVIIKKIEGNKLTGVLDNDPVNLEGLKAGDQIHFTYANIYDVYEENND